MNKESIIREWFYRLPNGYATAPYSKKEMNVLHEVLAENGMNGSIFAKEVDQLDQAFHDAEPVEDEESQHAVTEEHDWLTERLLNEIEFNSNVFGIAAEAGKTKEFETFIKRLPSGEPKLAAIKFINSLDDKTLEEKFFKDLYGTKAPTKTMKLPGGFETELFDIDAKGIGKGELWGAWKFQDAEVQGGSESFDLAVGTVKYEVKDYSGKKAQAGRSETDNKSAIRVGVEGSVSKYAFWNQILETVNKVKKANAVENVWRKLPGGTEGNESDDWKKLFGPKVGKTLSLKDYIIDRVVDKMKIVTGEFNKTDTTKFIEFYTTFNKLLADIGETSINQISARGPNQKPVSIVIEPISLEDIPETGEITLNVSDRTGGATATSVINYMKELKYVRNPETFMKDVNAAVADIIDEGQADYWMVFRGKASDINVKIISKARASEFQFSTISQNGIKFIEPGE